MLRLQRTCWLSSYLVDLRRKDSNAAGSLLLSLTCSTQVNTFNRFKSTKQEYPGERLHLNSDRKAVISEGLEAETARLLGGLPHRHEVP